MPRLSTACLLVLASLGVGCSSSTPTDGFRGDKADDLCSDTTHLVDLSVDFGERSFTQPVAALPHPSDPARWYIVEQRGIVWTMLRADGVATPRRFVDLRDRVNSEPAEGGMYSMALHPNFDQNGEVFLSYTAAVGTDTTKLESRISRFHSLDAGLTLDRDNEEILLRFEQPFENHNGGQIAFGPDGMLYIGFGDGGSAGDPMGMSQNPDVPFGKILRIDVDGGTPFAVPDDNPFVQGTGLDTVYALGLRNPWKFSFDSETGELWLGDVGQDTQEEVNIISAGGNYGWNVKEGDNCFAASPCAEDFIAPVATYGRDEGISISGGFVYRGSEIPELVGAYVFADFGSGKIWSLTKTASGEMVRTLIRETSENIAGFAQDNDGEIFVLGWSSGKISKLVPGVAETCDEVVEPAQDIDPDRVLTFDELYDQVLSVDCAPCHTQRALGGLRMLDADDAFENLVNVPAETSACGGHTRVVPGNAVGSLLFQKTSGIELCGPQMPLGGSMSPENIDHIRKWIEAGAAR